MLHKDISVEQIEFWLRENDPEKLQTLWNTADEIRKRNVGDEVHLRGLVEISNFCVRRCKYCGFNADNKKIERYRMPREEIIDSAKRAHKLGFGTVVIQAGEDYGLETSWMADIITHIKTTTPLAVTLSLGERPFDDLQAWRKAGADRYLLRFETSDQKLYKLIHPPLENSELDRFEILTQLKELGYETGSGVMIGIPGQTYSTLAQDIAVFRDFDLDMVGVGPYIINPNTPLGSGEIKPDIDPSQQVPPSELMTYKTVAVTRIVCPQANIPSTTALATINKKSGRELGLSRGANVVMPNVTSTEFRVKYEIYPGKACINETAEKCQVCLAGRIASIGREVGKGQGGRKHGP